MAFLLPALASVVGPTIIDWVRDSFSNDDEEEYDGDEYSGDDYDWWDYSW